MEISIEEVIKSGKIAEACICYTGDILNDKKDKYNLDYYIKLAKEIEKTGAHILGIKDMSALLKPHAAFKLINALKQEVGMPIHLHTHDTTGNGVATVLMAAEAGVDDFMAEATPEGKLALIREYQEKGMLVAMTGDGTNDAPALAQADVGVAMNSGTQAAKEAGNMVDLDSNPTKLIEIVEIGKQLLMTRGSLTTFSIANDVAKYFAIIPALFSVAYPAFGVFNVMGLATPESAILSAVIFNALIIIGLVPLALRGVKYEPMGADVILRRNLIIYGLGGLAAPFIGIKVIDMLLVVLHLV